MLDVGREPRECETASGAGEVPPRHARLQWEMGRSWGPSCTGRSPPGCSVVIYADQHRFRMPQLPFSPKGLISYLFPNYNLTLLERPEFLMSKAGRAHLALSREQGPMAFPLSAFAESKQGEVSGMPPPCRTYFASPGAAHTAPASLQGGNIPLRRLGTEPGLGLGRWVARAVQCMDPLLMGYKGCRGPELGCRGFLATDPN